MAYIGREPVNGFHAKQTLSTDGSTVTFTLDFSVADETSIIVSVGGVLQEPKVAYNLAAGGTQITFTAAPAATDTAYIHYLGQAIVQNLVDLNGVALVLDADADTTIAADTDDQIDIQIAGADDFQFTANKFSVLTGSSQSFADSAKGLFGTGDDLEIYHDGTNSLIANKTGALKIATETSGIAVTIGHTTSETTVADNLTVTGNLTVGGTTSFGDFDITNVGSIALDTITNDGTDITLDSSADIVIDAAGGNIEFKDAGTLQLTLDMDGTAGAQVIQLGVDSDDLIFKQYDGTTVLTLDDDTTVKVATDLTIGDDASLISDSAVLGFGADTEVTLTHVHNTGILLNSTNVIQFNDASQNIGAPSATVLDINATDEIELNATLVDINANLDVSGTITSGGVVTATGFTIGSAAINETELEILDGATLTTTELNYVDGVTSAIQTQLDAKLPLAGGTMTGTLKLNDNVVIYLGTGDDLQLKHDGSNSFLRDVGAGNLIIEGENNIIVRSVTGSEKYIEAVLDGGVDLYHNNVKKFETTANGVTATDGILVSGTTPTVTVGDGGAEDAKIIFDGNAQNFHIGLDDSGDKLTIGLGNTLGTTPGFTMDENTNVVFPDNSLTIISSGNGDNLILQSTDTDANYGPNLEMSRPVTGATNDLLGRIDFFWSRRGWQHS